MLCFPMHLDVMWVLNKTAETVSLGVLQEVIENLQVMGNIKKI